MEPQQSTKFRTTNIRKYFSHALWAFRRIWAANRKLAIGLMLSMTLRALLPAGIALTSRGLINAAVWTIRNGGEDLHHLYPWLIGGFIFTLLLAIVDVISKTNSQLLYNNVNLKITTDILQHASKLDISFFEDPKFQDVIERAQQNPAMHFSQFVTNAINAVATFLQVLFLSLIVLHIEPLVIIAFILMGIPYFLLRWRLARTRYLKEHSRTTMHRWNRYFVGRLMGQQSVIEVKLFNLAPVLFEKYRAFMQKFLVEDNALYMKEAKESLFFSLVSTLVFYLAFVRVTMRAIQGTLTVGDVFLYGAITAVVRKTLENLINSVSGVMEETLYIANLRDFLSLQPRIIDGSRVLPTSVRGEIEFKNVTFRYPGNTEPALNSVSACIQMGETVAIVGENGAGKTTFSKLIARLYDPEEGTVLLDGTDLRDLTSKTLREQLSFMPQRFGRYEGTVAENIAYGNWENLLDRQDEIERCAGLTDVHEMILNMPHGYQTILGRMFGTYDPSEGQWQQIALARAFSRAASVFILDEPAAYLDARTEYRIFSRVRELARGRTTILISHRFSTVSMADKIIVLQKGKIMETGTHTDLLASAGLYATLYELQTRKIKRELKPSGFH